MTLGEFIEQYRPTLADESIAFRRSWEEMFKYTLRHYPGGTPLRAFDLQTLSDRWTASGMNRQIAEGYLKRWREVLTPAAERLGKQAEEGEGREARPDST